MKSLLFWKLYSISKATMEQSKQQKKKTQNPIGWMETEAQWRDLDLIFFDLLESPVGSKLTDKHGIEICSVEDIQGLIPGQFRRW